MKIESTNFGKLTDGREVKLFSLSNNNLKIKITNYGAIITCIEMPDKNGVIENVVCGFEKLEN